MDSGLNIVIVEDYVPAREELAILLRRHGWNIAEADSGEELNVLLGNRAFEIAILDLNLPHEDGLSICARLKASHPNMGIVMLTARARVADRAQGYQSGADVYLTKPLNPEELIAVIHNLSRRIRPVGFHRLTLDTKRHALVNEHGHTCRLTSTEVQLLHTLCLMPNRQADTDYLIGALSNRHDQDITRDNLTVIVSRLRSKTMDIVPEGNLISAVRGYGYRLNQALTLG